MVLTEAINYLKQLNKKFLQAALIPQDAKAAKLFGLNDAHVHLLVLALRPDQQFVQIESELPTVFD